MIHIRSSYFFSLLVSFALLVAPLHLSAMVSFSPLEADIIMQNADVSYIYMGKELSNIEELISRLCDLDNNENSPLHILDKHIKNGIKVAEYNAVVEVLEYADLILENDYTQLSYFQEQKIKRDIDAIMHQISNGDLVVNVSNITNFQDKINKKTDSLPASLDIFDLDGIMYSASATRLVAKTPAVVVSIANESLSGLSTIDGVALSTNDRVLLVNQTNPIENGLWEAQTTSWTRPADFATGDLADQAYVLILLGSTNAGSSWLCTTPVAVIDTDPITFVLFSLADTTLAANVGTGAGLIFRDKTGTTLNIKSLSAGSDVVITNNADDITIETNATNLNTASTIVARDASGNFSAGIISVTDGVISTSLRVTPFSTAGVVHNNASGLLATSLIVNADISGTAAIADSKLATINTAGKVSNTATTANTSNLGNAIVSRDASGNFAAGIITASLNGNAATATSATTATNATSFTGSLIGDVTGTQGATVVSLVGGQTATNIANAMALVNASTAANTANALVRRGATGNFSAGAVSMTDSIITSTSRITPFATAGVVHNNTSGVLSSSLITNADIIAAAGIVDSKLATISTAGKVANTATTATGLNTASAIVARDASGNFSANIVIADLLGAASENLLKVGDTMTGTLQLPAGTTALPSLRFTGSTTTGLSASSSNLSLNTNGLERVRISSGGIVSIRTFTSAGVVKNDASGNLSSSLIVDSNIAAGAGIIDTKLATISTTGKVANSATTATDANTANAIVRRDTLGNFSANVMTIVDVAASGSLILSTDPSTSTAGNIFKGVNTPFIHNFGTDNTFVGINAGNFSMTGRGQNCIFGSSSYTSNSSGEDNTGLGFSTLPDCISANNNIAIGSGSGAGLITGNGNIYINATASSSSEAATTRIGTSQTQCFIAGIRGITTTNANAISVLIDSAGQLGTVSSSERYKHDIQDMNNSSANLLALRPVTFAYNNDESETLQFGLIAEEVATILPEIVVNNEDGQPETVQYHVLPVLLLNEMKKQQAIIEEQDARIENLTISVETMNAALISLQKQIQQFMSA